MSPAARIAASMSFLLLPIEALAVDSPLAPANDAVSIVRRLEREWLDAYEKNDPVAMERIVANDFLITFPDGSQQTKAQIVAMVRRPPRPGAEPPKFTTENVRTIVRDGTVIVIGILVTTQTRDRKTNVSRMRYTDTWVLGKSGWQVVASGLSQWTPPPDTSRGAVPDSTS